MAETRPPPTALQVLVREGKDLYDTSFLGKMDPFCEVTLGTKKQKTGTHSKGGRFPTWNQTLPFTFDNEQSIGFRVADKDMLTTDYIGSHELCLTPILNGSRAFQGDLMLTRGKGKPAGYINVQVTFYGEVGGSTQLDSAAPRQVVAPAAAASPAASPPPAAAPQPAPAPQAPYAPAVAAPYVAAPAYQQAYQAPAVAQPVYAPYPQQAYPQPYAQPYPQPYAQPYPQQYPPQPYPQQYPPQQPNYVVIGQQAGYPPQQYPPQPYPGQQYNPQQYPPQQAPAYGYPPHASAPPPYMTPR